MGRIKIIIIGLFILFANSLYAQEQKEIIAYFPSDKNIFTAENNHVNTFVRLNIDAEQKNKLSEICETYKTYNTVVFIDNDITKEGIKTKISFKNKQDNNKYMLLKIFYNLGINKFSCKGKLYPVKDLPQIIK